MLPAQAFGCACMQELKEEFDIDVKVLGIVGSKKMLLSDAPIDLASWQGQYERYVTTTAWSCLKLQCISLRRHSSLEDMPGSCCIRTVLGCMRMWMQTACCLALACAADHMHRTPAHHETRHMAFAMVVCLGRPSNQSPACH